MPELQPGLIGTACVIVAPSHLASALGSGRLDVYGTPAMIALIETAAVNAVDHLLPDGTVTVGSHLDIRHLAPSPPGVKIRATAELTEINGRRLTFRVEAFDPVEKIGEGTHERVTVDLARLSARATGKIS